MLHGAAWCCLGERRKQQPLRTDCGARGKGVTILHIPSIATPAFPALNATCFPFSRGLSLPENGRVTRGDLSSGLLCSRNRATPYWRCTRPWAAVRDRKCLTVPAGSVLLRSGCGPCADPPRWIPLCVQILNCAGAGIRREIWRSGDPVHHRAENTTKNGFVRHLRVGSIVGHHNGGHGSYCAPS
jgi:hypothetical protein